MVSLLFSLAFLVLGFFFLLVAAWTSWGIVHVLRSSQRSQRYLSEAKDEQPLQVEHLSHDLQRIAHDTRLLRISLEAPIRDIAEFRRGELHEAAAQDLDSFDNMLMDVTLQLTEWVNSVDRLDESDRGILSDLGLGADPIRRALAFEGGAFERKNVRRGGGPPMDERLKQIADELQRFEASMTTLALRPYR